MVVKLNWIKKVYFLVTTLNIGNVIFQSPRTIQHHLITTNFKESYNLKVFKKNFQKIF